MHAFNDIYQTSEGRLAVGEFRFDYGHFFGALGQRVNPRDQFRNQLRNAITHNWLTRTWYSDLRGEEPRSEKAKVDLIRALPSFRRNLEALEKRVRQDGAHFVLATQPFLYRPDLSAEERDSLFYNYYYRDYAIVPTVEQQLAAMRRFNEATRSIAARLGSTLVDLEYHLPKTFEFLFDDVHYTIDGAKRVASIFAKNVPWDNFISDTLLEEQPRR
jgi:hypothetical protein